MSIRLDLPDLTRELKPRITVFGVGGAGGNAVKNMIDAGLEGIEFVVANTDAQALEQNCAERKIQMGVSVTQGLGAGSHPEIGRAAAEEALPEILENLHGSHMVFVTAGMGGGTGTGAAPVIAAAAREQGILTIGVVTKPFQFEGARRMRTAEGGVAELAHQVDTLLVIPNQNLFRLANEKTTFADAFAMADRVLHSGVSSITDLMVKPGLINLDFADVRAVMDQMGEAMMGTGEASGEKRSLEAAQAAISNPLLDDVSMKGARGVLINITGGMDMTLYEVDEAANHIRSEVDPDCNIIIGSTFDPALEGVMRVSVVAAGIGVEETRSEDPYAWNQEKGDGTFGKVTSIDSARRAGKGASAVSAQAGGARAVSMEEGTRAVAPARRPISLGRIHRRGGAMPAVEEADAPLGSADMGESEYEAEVIFNPPPGAATPSATADADKRMDEGEEESAASPPATVASSPPSAATPSSPSSSAMSTQDAVEAVRARMLNAPQRKPERRGFWNAWFGGGRENRPAASPSSFSRMPETAGSSRQSISESGGAEAEDQLEIPAFMRRKAN